MRDLVIVNAGNLLSNAEVQAKIPSLQTQVDRDFLPAWGARATAVTVRFCTVLEIPNIPASSWAIFLNRHSNDPGALGWHDDQADRVFARVFVGDCKAFGLNWGVTLSHELLEMLLDPDIKRVWPMPDGRLAALEACDAVESDALSYPVFGHPMSNFVLPGYFSTDQTGPWDFRKALTGPCPALATDGYMSLSRPPGPFTQIQAEHLGIAGRRALLPGHRRMMRSRIPADQLIAICEV